MTALPGAGAFTPVAPEPEPPAWDADDEPPEAGGADPVAPPLFWSLICCAKGSLLAKRLNEASCPSCTAGAGDEASDEPLLAGAGNWLPPASVGAASVGVAPVGAGVVDAWWTGGGADGCSCFMTRGTWKASTPTKRTPRTPAMIFCFFCFALRGSTCFFATTELLSPTRSCPSRPSWSSLRWSSSRPARRESAVRPALRRRRRRR